MTRVVYNLLLIILLPFALLRLFWRARKNPGYAKRIPERFAYYANTYQSGGIVVHAVSVGETVAAYPLIKALQSTHPDLPITVTSMTPTGSARVKTLLGDSVQHVYLPYDFPWCVNKFLKTFQPKLFIVMETEWWPNLFFQCKKHNIPLMVANARLSERSMRGYQRVKSLSEPMAQSITCLSAQTDADAERFKQLGVKDAAIHITGNIKFDNPVDETVQQQAQALRKTIGTRPVWIAASTHAGEEFATIQAIQAVLKQHPQALAIVVPRHPERFQAFFDRLKEAGLNIARRSNNAEIASSTQVYYVDAMGELMACYGAADVAFVAGSLVPAGGHNMIEAIQMGTPVIMGPHVENIARVAQQLIDTEGMASIQDAETLGAQINAWLGNPEAAEHSLRQAQAFLKANQGSVERNLTLVSNSLTNLV